MRNKLLWFVVMVAGLQVAGGRLQAHHAFAAEFDAEKKVTMDGTVAEMHWINPHAWLYVDVPGPDGTVDRWGFEFGAPNALIRRGWTKSTVPLGLELTIVGYLAKDGRKLAYAETVLLPDGRKLFAGSSGRRSASGAEVAGAWIMKQSWLVGVVGSMGRAVLAMAVLSAFGCEVVGQSADTLPRLPDGTPDLQGIWQVLNTADVNIQDHAAGSNGPAGSGVVLGNELPYQPWALAKRQENYENRLTADPVRNCFLPGVPRATYLPFPFQIVQAPGHVAILYEYVHAQRRVYTNGTPHPADLEFWMGDSRGRWDGDTLVVDVANFNDLTWFDRAGNFHSNALHVVERYTRLGPDHMQYEATIEDPQVFTRPLTMRMLLYRRKEPNAQLFDYQCYAFDHDTKGLSIPLVRIAGPE